jgi:polyvinyl alcohol dehydrogenase (cytochrome)
MNRISAAGAAILIATAGWGLASVEPSAQPSGEAVYRERCAGCHDLVTARIPPRAALQKMAPARILRTLDFGGMMNIASPLRRDEREAVAQFLGQGPADPPMPPSAYCRDRTVKIGAHPGMAVEWMEPERRQHEISEG